VHPFGEVIIKNRLHFEAGFKVLFFWGGLLAPEFFQVLASLFCKIHKLFERFTHVGVTFCAVFNTLGIGA